MEEAIALGVTYDPLAPAVVNWIRERAINIGTNVIVQSRDTVRGILSRSSSVGLTPEVIASAITQELWLYDRHASSVDATRYSMLDSGLSWRAIEAATTRTAGGYRKFRADSISISEITTAISAALAFIWGLALAGGILSRDQLKIWVTARDEKVCPVCGPNHGLTLPISSAWPWGDPPAHPRCRCRVERVK